MEAAGYSSWADLNSDLLVSITAAADSGLSLRDYVCLRRVCTAWRSALAPPYPCLLSLNEDGRRASVFSLPTRRWFLLDMGSPAIDYGHDQHGFILGAGVHGRARIVGSGNGRFAVVVDHSEQTLYRQHDCYNVCWTDKIFLLDPRARKEVQLLALPLPADYESECVHKVVFAPDPDDGTIVAICDRKRVAYVDTGGKRSNMMWKTADVIPADALRQLVDVAFGDDGKVYCLDSSDRVRVLRIPRGCQGANEPSLSFLAGLVPGAFAPPYGIASKLMAMKYLFFCHGSLYQVWRNTSATISLGMGYKMSAGEIFVLRYDPGRWPCWYAVKDLGGCSVFIGMNSSPTVVRGDSLLGVRADCVYWIDWDRVPMVCDIATGTSQPCVLPYGVCKGNCWYFRDDNMVNNAAKLNCH